ncbi:FecR/PupR family sigma factor regulator [Achromobacter sp. DMS1]|uniref:FecR/PupR family sigma factor regulator n=1 Tax=Achromobacter sp. DMS1 TaxID=1688405 RepID=UPI001F3F84CB|nr:DUF4880 domain-containing protein [Achromobacter sp. DMS1]
MAASSWYRSTRDAAAVSPEVAERALEWLLELQGEPVPPETMQAWRRWRAAHPDHERAWRRIESVRGSLQPLASPLSAAAAQAALAPSASRNRRRAPEDTGPGGIRRQRRVGACASTRFGGAHGPPTTGRRWANTAICSCPTARGSC